MKQVCVCVCVYVCVCCPVGLVASGMLEGWIIGSKEQGKDTHRNRMEAVFIR